jgi:hypothetical protein
LWQYVGREEQRGEYEESQAVTNGLLRELGTKTKKD